MKFWFVCVCLRSLALILVSVTGSPWIAHGFVVTSSTLSGSSSSSGSRYGAKVANHHAARRPSANNSRRCTMMAKKPKFTINENLLVGTINSDGVFEGRTKTERPKSNKLGVASLSGVTSASTSNNNNNHHHNNRDNKYTTLSKKDRQRTANGRVDSTKTDDTTPPDQQAIQVVEGKRGPKIVTMIRGMVSPMEVRRELLKELKKALGVGGTLVDGVLELQGAYGDKAVAVLRKKGYDRTKRIET